MREQLGENPPNSTHETGDKKAQHISREELTDLIKTLGCEKWVEIGYIMQNGEISPMRARIVTDNESGSGPGSGMWIETGVGSSQFVRRDKIAYIRE